MSASLLLSHHSVIFLLLLVSVSLLPTYDCAEDDPSYRLCKQNFDCGLLPNLSYPFWGFRPGYLPIRSKLCGGGDRFELLCEPDSYPIIDHRLLLYVNQSSKVMGWIDKDVWNLMLCPWNYANLSVLKKPSPEENNRAPAGSVFLRLYSGCDRNKINVSNLIRLPCPIRDEEGSDAFYSDEELGHACTFRGGFLMAKENISPIDNYGHLEESACHLCEGSHGICGTNDSTDRFACLCRDGLHEFSCEVQGKRSKLKNKTIVGVVTAGSTTIVIALVLFLIRRRRKNQQKLAPSSFASQNLVFDQSSRGDLEKIGSRYYGVHVFTYAELEDATNNFDREQELGDGGFGTVYFGKLRDGRSVAVKRLYENNYKRVEQFMNEIDILTRLSHPNLVSLYGCTSRHSRELLLVYEYIPNGTVADHLHGEKARPGALPWHTRINIAVDTASALAYLHASDIIHRDVKTNNILLDKNFNVKVADFGLSRLFPTDVSHVSTCPQGTPGYLDPEYHQCYQLTDKSDVYSFGVVLMELISSMTAVDITRHRHDINLSSMAMNKIQNDALHELVDPNLGYETDPAVRQMINAVAELGFTCLQMEKDWRPCMEEVLQKLQEIQTNGYSIEDQK